MLVSGGLSNVMSFVQLNIALFWEWILFTSNTPITESTVLSDLTEANWSGYVRIPNGSNVGPIITDGIATSYPYANPTFSNTDSVPHTFYGWGMVHRPTGVLVNAANVGPQTIAANGTVVVIADYTLQEG